MEITRAPRRGKNIERNFSSVSPQLAPKKPRIDSFAAPVPIS
jgi:hypothetical protein